MREIIKKFGFELLKESYLPKLNGTLYEMEHTGSGAKLLWLDNKQDNKLFSVTFKTIPENSTGVFHILEHSVLSGSKKYPVREPFVELLKSSMKTFLNAMTFPDKTMYPVSSRNHQDFLNLVSVYLDAVFAPSLLTNPNIFYQEGWHGEVLEEPCFKGVVYNEMKGAMAGVDDCIEQGLQQLLFPDTCYRHNSGGDPSHITDLTYDAYVQTYKKYYFPSNATFYLDGDIPLAETLERISSYLNGVEKMDASIDIDVQAPVAGELTQYYEVGEEENCEQKAIMTMGKIFARFDDSKKIFAAQVLCDVLCGSNDAPLKRAILDKGLAEDVRFYVMDGILQPYISLQVRNMKEESFGEVKAIIRETIQRVLEEGISERALEATIESFVYSLTQKSEPQGLYRAMNVMSSYLYGGDATLYLRPEEIVDELRVMAKNQGFEALLSELLLDEAGMGTLYSLPSKELGQKKQEEEQARLETYLSTVDQEALLEENKVLLSWQQTPDTPELLATLPMLSMEEMGEMPKQPQTEELDVNGVKMLYHPVPTDGVEYLKMYFTMEDYSMEELETLNLITSLYGKLPTKKYSVLTLQEEIKMCIGSINFGISAQTIGLEKQTCRPYFVVSLGYLVENKEKAISLALEILEETDFSQTDLIYEIIKQEVEEDKYNVIMSGHSVAVSAVRSHYSQSGALSEALYGFTGLKNLMELSEHFEEKKEAFVAACDTMKEKVLCKNRLMLSLTATKPSDFTEVVAKLPQGASIGVPCTYESKLPKRMAIAIPAQTSFAVKGYSLNNMGMKYDGSAAVLGTILSLNWLWGQIRVQGGAYGSGSSVDKRGDLFFYSYRDPSPLRSLSIYDQTADFLEAFEEDLDGYIISSVSGMDPLQTPASLGMTADQRWFLGITDDMLRETRKEAIAVTKETIQAWGKAYKTVAEHGAVCIVGNKTMFEEDNELEVFAL